MKFKLENNPIGVVICHILEPLTEPEGRQIIRGIEKVLTNGRTRIIVHCTNELVANAEGGALFLDTGLSALRTLAKKMGGDIQFVVPLSVRKKVAHSQIDLQVAIASMTGKPPVGLDQNLLRSHVQQNVDASVDVEIVRIENKYLIEKLRDLLDLVGKPSTDVELRAAVTHYKQLATEAVAAPPQSAAGAKKP